ncbi:MAG: hypothetical protein IT373_16075 [Polyangiaceae bacterium]|nr:hypothetical protein [Polyangiaceae bacterium]
MARGWSQRGRLVGLSVLTAAALGCTHAAPMRVRFADIGHGALEGFTGEEPLIVEFEPGDTLPVNLELSGDGFELRPLHPALELVATKRCFLRIGADGMQLVLDPEDFDRAPSQQGTFRVGFGAARGQPAKVDIVITAPRR